ncbi:hypothetical protein MPNT_20152 [Candidatus Methylacidithermus pantelleriae]|uniref:Uncharacterized protein n=1 Tax=Candidatus Methylacidithermus pantelleriae TaxID=2744239 RepID=A0A8J2BMJ1_9BACT|nr:hypothetical protein MPNT_20152 [Candidatus Methylacidithermus pantelleriae]
MVKSYAALCGRVRAEFFCQMRASVWLKNLKRSFLLRFRLAAPEFCGFRIGSAKKDRFDRPRAA